MSAPMKVLTLHQPWASLIALGAKTIETRSWRPPDALIGETIAIHASGKAVTRRFTELGDGLLGDWWVVKEDGCPMLLDRTDGHGTVWDLHHMPLGAIVATAELVDCIPMTGWADTGDPECIVVHDDSIDHAIPDDHGHHLIRDVTDQRPFGDFAPGRFAWLLDNVQQLDKPVPFKGGQGLTKSWTRDTKRENQPT